MRPLLLDLFCGAGGAAMGYFRAGFDVVGVDMRLQPRYPFEFHRADAFVYPVEWWGQFDAIHASPPCQAYSIMRNLPWLRDRPYPRLVHLTKALLDRTGLPYVIENVMGARWELDAAWLCGQMFGRPFFRHRLFASNILWLAPAHPPHNGSIRNGRALGSRARDIVVVPSNGAQRSGANIGHSAGVEQAKEAMGIDWMRREELSQAIPPIYTEFIGSQLIEQLRRAPAIGVSS